MRGILVSALLASLAIAAPEMRSAADAPVTFGMNDPIVAPAPGGEGRRVTLVPVEGNPFADIESEPAWRRLLPAAVAAVLLFVGAYAIWRWGRAVTTVRALAALAAFWVFAGVVGCLNSLSGLGDRIPLGWPLAFHGFAAVLLVVRVMLMRSVR